MDHFMKPRETLADWLVALGKSLGADGDTGAAAPNDRFSENTAFRDGGQEEAVRKLLEACARAFVPDGHHVPPHLDGLPEGAGTVVKGSRPARTLAPSQDVLVFEVVKAASGFQVDAGVSDVVDVRVLPPSTRFVVHLRSQGRPEDVPLVLGDRTLEMM